MIAFLPHAQQQVVTVGTVKPVTPFMHVSSLVLGFAGIALLSYLGMDNETGEGKGLMIMLGGMTAASFGWSLFPVEESP